MIKCPKCLEKVEYIDIEPLVIGYKCAGVFMECSACGEVLRSWNIELRKDLGGSLTGYRLILEKIGK